MPRLILLRHAKSDWPAGVDDLRRPLADRGIGDASAAGVALAELGEPDLVLCSPARRTRQTWQLVREELSGRPSFRVVPAIYGADERELLDVIQALGDDGRAVLVIGHNPTMQGVARPAWRGWRSTAPGPASSPEPRAWSSSSSPAPDLHEQFLAPRA
jgi:phosphohistidine phosphatase